MKRWWVFARERFDPLSHLVMIGLFVMAHLRVSGSALPPQQIGLIGAGVLAFFFKLRLYDELKDFELDCQINPTRPLARGLLQQTEVRAGILFCILLELACFGAAGWNGLCAISWAIGYSLLMYNEFFIRERIRDLLTTYALSHTIVCSLLSLAVLCAASGALPWELPADLLRFSLACWFIFNVFEFGRKTFAESEERKDVDSYSKVWGRPGAVLLLLSMTVAADYLLLSMARLGGALLWGAQSAVSGLLLLAGGWYVARNSASSAKLYRGASSAFIILTLVAVVSATYWPAV